jgi:hypothetical protein
MTNLSSFDLDFRHGQAGEKLVEELLTEGKTIEVKRDRKWSATGNIYIEVSCWYQRSQSWEQSGLYATEAEYWAFVLEKGVLMVPTPHVHYAIEHFGREITCEIPPNRSKGFLITVDNLLEAMRNMRDE